MGLDDQLKNGLDQATGAAKEQVGNLTGDKEQQTEGQLDQAKANLQDVGDNVKDAAGNIADTFKN